MDIKGHTVHKVMIAPAADIAEEYYVSFLLDRTNRTFLSMASVEGGVEIEVAAHENPDALAQVPVDPRVGVDDAKAARDRRGDRVRGRRRRAGRRHDQEPVGGLRRGGRDPRRGQPAGQARRRLARGARRQGLARRERRLPPRRPRTARGHEDDDPLEAAAKEKGLNYVKLDGEVGIIGNGAGLVMSTLDVVAYAGEKHGGVKPANFLDIGGGASAEVMANGLEIILGDPDVKSVFVNVFGGITACDEVANGIVQALQLLGDEDEQAARRAPRRQQRGAGPPDPRRRRTTRWSRGGHHGRRGRQGRRAREQLKDEDTQMAIFLTENSKVIVQGMTGSEGMKHTKRMLAAGTNIVGGVNPRKAGKSATFADGTVPVFGTVAEAMDADRRRRVGRLRAAGVHQGRRGRGDRRRDPARRRDHRGRAGARHRRVLGVRRVASQQGTTTRIIGPNCPGLITPGKSNAGIIPADITKPGRIGLVSKSGTLTYQMMYELRDFGFSSCVGIGGDPIIGTTHIDALAAFEADPDTDLIVMIGEIGGDAEERAAAYIKDHVTKPVVGYVAGFTAPEGKTMGHAGAIVSGSSGTAPRRRRPSRPPASRSARRRPRPPT